MKTNIDCIVIAPPGHFRTSLTALLASIHHIGSMTMVDEVDLLNNLPRNIHPDFVFIEARLLTSTFKDRIRFLAETWPEARKVIFSEHTNLLTRDETFGADCVLPKEISAGDFLQLVNRLSSPTALLMPH